MIAVQSSSRTVTVNSDVLLAAVSNETFDIEFPVVGTTISFPHSKPTE